MYSPHTLVAFGGTITGEGTGDIWQCGLRYCEDEGDPGAPSGPIADPVGYMGAIAVPLSTWFASSGAQMRADFTLAWLKVNDIGPDGKYSDPSTTNQHDYSSPAHGNVAATIPNILTECFSWTTDKKRGPGHTGRIYPPWNIPAQPGMVLSSTAQGFALTSALALLDLLGPIPDGYDGVVTPVVASKVNATNTMVTGIRIGSVIDVQRRRKNALTETYVTSVWPTS